jgi:hypothetical protein
MQLDAAAAQIMLRSSTPLIVPIKVTHQVYLRERHLVRPRADGPLAALRSAFTGLPFTLPPTQREALTMYVALQFVSRHSASFRSLANFMSTVDADVEPPGTRAERRA